MQNSSMPIESEPSKKLYIATFKFEGLQNRVFFEGEDSERGEQQYRHAIEGLSAIGDSAQSWADFLPRVIKHFEKFGFIRTAH